MPRMSSVYSLKIQLLERDLLNALGSFKIPREEPQNLPLLPLI